MRFAVEAWAPEYGSSMGSDDEIEASSAKVDADVEVPLAQWEPKTPPPGAAIDHGQAAVVFTDGVRRVEAQVWVEAPDGSTRPGICASYAAGAVRCDGRAELVVVEVRRGLFTAAPEAETIETAHGDFDVRAVGGDSPDKLSLCLQQRMGELEVEVVRRAAVADGDLVCVDGPLRTSGHLPGAIGYVKTHHVHYLDAAGDAVVGRLDAGQRTPVFLATARMWTRYSWYLRLPGGGGGHPWSGVVRCETGADTEPAKAIELADRVAATLPRFASVAHKDPRAPQNLFPIGGLERLLRHRLGDPALIYRALRAAARPARSSVV
jgi:hypothetical protein